MLKNAAKDFSNARKIIGIALEKGICAMGSKIVQMDPMKLLSFAVKKIGARANCDAVIF